MDFAKGSERTPAWPAYLNGANPEEPNIEDCVGNEARQVQSDEIETEPHDTGEKAQRSQNERRGHIRTHQKADSKHPEHLCFPLKQDALFSRPHGYGHKTEKHIGRTSELQP